MVVQQSVEQKKSLPLVDRARPKELSDLVLDSSIRTTVENILKDPQKMPHLLLYGPAGTGKTSLAKIIINKILGDSAQFNCLSLNASDDRGIDVIRNLIKGFVKSRPFLLFDQHKPIGKPPFKIVFLDECDQLTDAAQHALRSIVTENTSRARFIFSCNYYNQITPQLKSRTLPLEFKAHSFLDVYERAKKALQENKVDYDTQQLWALCKKCRGDFRNVYNNLGLSTHEAFDLEKPIEALCELLINNKSYENLVQCVNKLSNLKSNSDLVFEQILNYLNAHMDKFTDEKLFFVVDRLSRAQLCIKLGGDPVLQLLGWGSSCLR